MVFVNIAGPGFARRIKIEYAFGMHDAMGKEKITTDLSRLLKPFENRWVALSPTYDRVVSSGDTLSETLSGVSEGEQSQVVLYRVLPGNSFYAPSS